MRALLMFSRIACGSLGSCGVWRLPCPSYPVGSECRFCRRLSAVRHNTLCTDAMSERSQKCRIRKALMNEILKGRVCRKQVAKVSSINRSRSFSLILKAMRFFAHMFKARRSGCIVAICRHHHHHYEARKPAAEFWLAAAQQRRMKEERREWCALCRLDDVERVSLNQSEATSCHSRRCSHSRCLRQSTRRTDSPPA